MAQAAKGRLAEQDAAGEPVDMVTGATRHVALLAAALATGGSLFFSEALGWIPCELCWIQRILMYPLALILTVGIIRDDRGVHLYVLPLSLTGVAVALYHYLMVLKVVPPADCTGSVPCSVDYLTPILTGPLSFIKVPFLALVAFSIISVMMGNYALAGAPAAGNLARARGAAIAIVAVVAAGLVALSFAV